MGSVSRSGALALTFKGKSATRLLAGEYRFVIADDSRTAAFLLEQRQQPAITLAAPGSGHDQSVSVQLTPGDWFFMPRVLGKRTGFVVVPLANPSG